MTKALSGLNESEILVEVLRNNFRKSFRIKPIYDSKKDSLFIGIKVKDSIAGIGTITYIDPTNGGTYASSIEKIDEMLKGSGNTFIGYVR